MSNDSWLVKNGKWLAGYVILWGVLTVMVDTGTGEIAAALGVTIAATVYLVNGKEIFAEINRLVG